MYGIVSFLVYYLSSIAFKLKKYRNKPKCLFLYCNLLVRIPISLKPILNTLKHLHQLVLLDHIRHHCVEVV